VEKRVIIAVALSILVISVWHKFTANTYVPKQDVVEQKTSARFTEEVIVEAPEKSFGKNFEKTEKINEQKTTVQTDQFIVTLSNVGGCITSIDLKEYKNGDGDAFYNLMSEEAIGRGAFTITSPELNIGKDTLLYDLEEKGRAIEYSAVTSNSIKITKSYIFRNKDLAEITLSFQNVGSEMQAFGYDVIGGSNVEAKEPLASRYVQVDAKVNETIHRDRSARNGILLYPGKVQWVALKNKFFAMVLKPFNPSHASFIRKYEDKTIGSGIRMTGITLSPGAVATHNFLLYIGPKKPERLASVGMELDGVIHYGIFGGISQLLLSGLRLFYKFTHSWGVSIILLSAMINLMLSPLTRKSYKSMQKMQALQPEIKKVQAQHKNNSQKLNKEIMELYRKNNINPLGGCFPMLLQMPIFIALYQGLIRFIELKNTSFLWIKDLSLPDSVNFAFLGGKGIHILPILMGGAMFFQQKFSHPQHQAGLTEQQRQQQRMMSFMMPLLFGFIFYNFPSGLVLYWLTNTVVMTTSQVMTMRKGA